MERRKLMLHELLHSKAAKDAMLGFLFRGLTAEPARGAALFDALTTEARRPAWYVEGAVPDTLDGRFSVLSNLMALALVRLESEGNEGQRISVALTERFIEVMESEHRELGLGDPSLGKTVRKLVGMLAKRTELWRTVDEGSFASATRESLYKEIVADRAVDWSTGELKRFKARLASTPAEEIGKGAIA
ncbi:MAG: ubiquinol-cytochrome C chaperone family protein [Sphingomicrobium sp.]